ncbi:MAG: serine/threonine protein kinase [Bacteroidales bacterium]|nr:serine/threonine protein kinase [Bacteroidales bacterium]
MDQSSDSGFVNKPIVSGGTDEFADYVEMPCGGFNRLFRAKRYGKWFVLKGLKPEFSSNPIYRNLLDKEFELGMMLSHPNIVTIYGKEYDAIVGYCIVMECVDGVTLEDFLKTNPSSNVVMKVIGEILSAMSYFHGLQVIHRDIKPSNILVTRNGNNVKIIDFGFSDTDSHAILKQPAGTARYAAPEQVEGNAALDNRADIYSFGVVLNDIVTATGFRGCSAVVRKCTQTNRKKRYGSATEILSAIKSHRKMMILLPVLVALLLFLGIGTAILYSHWNNSVVEDVSAPSTDTVVVSHIDTVVLSRVEDIDGNVPVQNVVVRSQAYTDSEQELLDEVGNRIEALYLSYKKDIENYDGYREFVNLKLACFSKEAINIGQEIEKRSIQDEDLFASQFVNYYGSLNYKYYSKLEEMSQNIPSFQNQYNDGIITKEQYLELSDRYIMYADSLRQIGALY